MRNTVKRAYHINGRAERTLLNSEGLVYLDGSWQAPHGAVYPLDREPIERWVDVPQAWLGVAVWWR